MKTGEENKRRGKLILVGVIILAFMISGIKMYWDGYVDSHNPECMVEYGHGECINGFLKIPFYNPNQQDITRIRIIVPFGIKTNITLPADFNVNEPLRSGETGVLTLFACEKDVDIRGFSVEWCCGGGCYRSSMGWISEEIKIEE